MYGLTKKEVLVKIEKNQVNKVKTKNVRTKREIFLKNILTFYNLLSLFIALWMVLIGAFSQTFFIGVVIINTLIGIYQELRAKKVLDALSFLNETKVFVIRDSLMLEINADEIVEGDVLYYNAGSQIAVDGILLVGNITCDESLLTGESVSIYKTFGQKVLSGSIITNGTGFIKATSVGENTFIQKITTAAKKYERPNSIIFNNLNLLMRVIGIIIIPLGILLFLKLNSQESFYNASIQTAAALIGMIPAGLFLLTSTALAVSVFKMAKQKTLVKELYCIEMLARVDTLCLDKTGTLTDGTMKLVKVSYLTPDAEDYLAFYVNKIEDESNMIELLKEKFKDAQVKNYKLKKMHPFSIILKYSQIELEEKTLRIGAPDKIVGKNYHKYEPQVNQIIDEGYRVIALSLDDKILAYILYEDNIRKSSISAINYFQKNNVNIKIITGDFAKSASIIARKIGVNNYDKYLDVSNLTDKELIYKVNDYVIFGRTTPHQKKILINAFKSNNKKVAMTGDGINDILALKNADVSIAMSSGSQAVRNISHLVLLDNNFANMPDIVFEGRKIINNIEKVSSLFLTKTFFSILLSLVTLIMFHKYSFIPIQLTIINFFMIGIPSFILSFKKNTEIIKKGFLKRVFNNSIPPAIVILIIHVILNFLVERRIVAERFFGSTAYYATSLVLINILIKIVGKINQKNFLLIVSMISGIFISPIIFSKHTEILPIYKLDINTILLILESILIYPFIVSFYEIVKDLINPHDHLIRKKIWY